MKWLLTCLLAIAFIDARAGETLKPPGGRLEPPTACGNFLRAQGLQRADVRYIACRPGEFGGVGTLTAEYRVRGKDVLNVENWLVKLAHVRRLKRTCCIWETTIGNFNGPDGSEYYVSMAAEATINSRRELTQVPYFNLTVTHYLWSP